MSSQSFTLDQMNRLVLIGKKYNISDEDAGILAGIVCSSNQSASHPFESILHQFEFFCKFLEEKDEFVLELVRKGKEYYNQNLPEYLKSLHK